MSAYTEDDVQAAVKATRRVKGGTIVGLLVENEVRMALDAVAPAIAARALREAAEVVESSSWETASTEGPGPGSDQGTWMHGADCGVRFSAHLLRQRAEEIDAP